MTTTSNINALHRALFLHQMALEDIRIIQHVKDCMDDALTSQYQDQFRRLREANTRQARHGS